MDVPAWSPTMAVEAAAKSGVPAWSPSLDKGQFAGVPAWSPSLDKGQVDPDAPARSSDTLSAKLPARKLQLENGEEVDEREFKKDITLLASDPASTKSILEALGGTVVESAGLNYVSPNFARRVYASQAALWISHQSHGDNGLTKRSSRSVANLIRNRLRQNMPFIMEGPQQAWPSRDDFPKRTLGASALLHTCALHEASPCIKYLAESSNAITPLPCVCHGARRRKATAAERHAARQSVTQLLMDQLFATSSRSERQPPMAVVTRAGHTCAEGSSDKGGDSYKKVTFEDSFPTAQAERQKQQRKARNEELRDRSYTDDQIKQMTRKRPQGQEEHFDDCGSDTAVIEFDPDGAYLMMSTKIEDLQSVCFEDDACEPLPPSDTEQSCEYPFELSYLYGSEGEAHPCFRSKACAHYVSMDRLNAYFLDKPGAQISVMEILGGVAGVTRISMRYRLACGPKVDLITGADVTRKSDADALLGFIRTMRPAIIAMGPPFRLLDNSTTRARGESLAKLAAEAATAQITGARHAIIENPSASTMWSLPCFRKLWSTGKIGRITFPQCALGLVVDNEPIQKLTTLWATSPELLAPFEGLQCTCARHGVIRGTRESVAAAIYPLEMCRLLAAAIASVERKTQRDRRIESSFPGENVANPGKRGRPRKYPEGVEFDCPACKRRLPMTDPLHTRREEPPGLCKHPDVEPMQVSCPACAAGKAADHPDHTHDDGCRSPNIRASGRRRRGGDLREPRLPAHGDSSQRNRQNDDHDFDADAVSSGMYPPGLDPPPGAPDPRGLAPLTREEIPVVGDPMSVSAAPRPCGASVTLTPAERVGPGASVTLTPAERVGPAAPPAGTDMDDDMQREAEPGVGNPFRPQTARERRMAALRFRQSDAEVQASADGQEDWRTFDVSKALTALRSPDPAIRRKALQQLHLRWWHAGASAMKRTLAPAGAPTQALAEIDAVVQACGVCRKWATPTEKTIVSHRLVFVFNEEVQLDLVFIRSQVEPSRGLLTVVHMIDVSTRWAMTQIVPNKEEETLCLVISTLWVSIVGPMSTLVVDHETALQGLYATDWAASQGVALKYKAPRQKAWVVERHNEMLRTGVHTTETQSLKEGIHLPFECTLAIVTFSLNSLTVINTSTPYQAVLGRQPQMLPPLEGGYLHERDPSLIRPGAMHRHEARVREIACTNIIEHHAKRRVERAHHARTQNPIEAYEYTPGELVDAWFEPPNKDNPRGWRGPGKILSVNTEEGNVTIRYQGHTLDRRMQEVRPHIAFLIDLVHFASGFMHHWERVRSTVENMRPKQHMTLGLLWHKGGRSARSKTGWMPTRATQHRDNEAVFQSALALASCQAGLHGITTVRLGRGELTLGPLTGFRASELWLWNSTKVQGGGRPSDPPMVFEPGAGDLEKKICIKHFVDKGFDLNDETPPPLQNVCFIQFLGMEKGEAVRQAVEHYRIPLLGGSGFPFDGNRMPTTAEPTAISIPSFPEPSWPQPSSPSIGVPLPCMMPTMGASTHIGEAVLRQLEAISGGEVPKAPGPVLHQRGPHSIPHQWPHAPMSLSNFPPVPLSAAHNDQEQTQTQATPSSQPLPDPPWSGGESSGGADLPMTMPTARSRSRSRDQDSRHDRARQDQELLRHMVRPPSPTSSRASRTPRRAHARPWDIEPSSVPIRTTSDSSPASTLPYSPPWTPRPGSTINATGKKDGEEKGRSAMASDKPTDRQQAASSSASGGPVLPFKDTSDEDNSDEE